MGARRTRQLGTMDFGALADDNTAGAVERETKSTGQGPTRERSRSQGITLGVACTKGAGRINVRIVDVDMRRGIRGNAASGRRIPRECARRDGNFTRFRVSRRWRSGTQGDTSGRMETSPRTQGRPAVDASLIVVGHGEG